MTLPAPQPAYVLRGHASQIHATRFIRSNSRLVTGDGEGWVVVWSLTSKRPTAVWQAHQGSILGVEAWGEDKLITHGKDNKVVVWKLSLDDETNMSQVLPVDTPPEPRKQPWLLHVFEVNTLNFCSFAFCPASLDANEDEEVLVAVPNTLTSEKVDIFHLPSEKRIHTVPNSTSFKGGMIMALSIFHHFTTSHLTVITGYESGHTSVSQLSNSTWQVTYISHPHLQPILSLSVAPRMIPLQPFYLTSSADANITRHDIPTDAIGTIGLSQPAKSINTKHAGQQGLQIRNDGKIFATAGWDSKVRVYATKSMKELAVLKWHKEGCYAVAFADVKSATTAGNEENHESSEGVEVATKAFTVAQERQQKAENTHWLAVGSKDGKVSLWDIY